ncbi:TPA: glycosyltransferase family 25 protein [Providencia stuartii]|uniref:glycosyltransferase family 25 protein n=1 Tax=Providencia TaxID=586 RepID=UPI00146E701B|nr:MULTISPECIES: glycosyltransferase family 25 protein [Providencia]MBN5558566.1 glycosyltransferase family 25 protein [Providencia stuartii]NMT49658.1 hypothetical protein [Providencia stuartii]HEM8265324.1 glycosyltransferase family 25 protein [Providencia stuartii]HEM8285326.1 glycosyltransferase family 25 protein [Providencia stuartii]HEM8302965.1 glycosyltransferase family 25 protein [Providencia stuartii]
MNNLIYIISLTSEEKRRKSISDQLEKLNQKFEFYDAFDFRFTDESVVNSYIVNDPKYNKPSRPLTKGEVGCMLSHISLISVLAESSVNSNVLILEDDAQVDPEIINLISSEQLNNIDWDLIILGYSKLEKNNATSFYIKEPIQVIRKINKIKLGYVWKEWTCGTVGYLINKKSLNKFRKLKVSTVADDWNYIQKKLNLKILHTRPLLIYEDFGSFASSIEKDRKNLLKSEKIFLEPIRLLRGLYRKLFFLLKSLNKRI